MSSEHPALRTQRAAAHAAAEGEQSAGNHKPAWDRTTKAQSKSALKATLDLPAPPPASRRLTPRNAAAGDDTQDSSTDEIRQMIQRVKVRRCLAICCSI
jgi:hypothetical protein